MNEQETLERVLAISNRFEAHADNYRDMAEGAIKANDDLLQLVRNTRAVYEERISLLETEIAKFAYLMNEAVSIAPTVAAASEEVQARFDEWREDCRKALESLTKGRGK